MMKFFDQGTPAMSPAGDTSYVPLIVNILDKAGKTCISNAKEWTILALPGDIQGEAMRSIATDQDRGVRRIELAAEAAQEARDRDAQQERARKANTDFTQVYPKGWGRLRELIKTNPSAARIYAFIAEHIDGVCGAVVVSQDVLAAELGVHVRTIKRLTKVLEDEGALVRIRVGTGVYAYALDPSEVWRSWDDKKPSAAFTTRTLVRKDDRENATIRRKLKIMMGEGKNQTGDIIKDPRQTDIETHLGGKED